MQNKMRTGEEMHYTVTIRSQVHVLRNFMPEVCKEAYMYRLSLKVFKLELRKLPVQTALRGPCAQFLNAGRQRSLPGIEEFGEGNKVV